MNKLQIKMIDYKYKKKENKFTENGHTMFEEDVLQRLKRLAYLEEQISVLGATEQLFDLYNVVRQSVQYCGCKVKGCFDTETLHRCRKCDKEMI